MTQFVDVEGAAVQLAAALTPLPLEDRRFILEHLIPDVRQRVLVLMPDLWPTPGECPDGC